VETLRSALSREKTDDMPYLSYTPTIGRNSNFVGLTLEQREELGGIEYRSLRTLAMVLLGYFWGFQILAFTFLLPYILHNQRYGAVVENTGVSKVWWAFFTSNSAFMDLGFTLTVDSMISFNTSQYILMIMWFFIIIGNTGFPVMLRFIIWLTSCIVPKHSGLWDELRFLLDHPRRCFTLLFPSGANWWLFWILVALNGIDLIFFIILDVSLPAILTPETQLTCNSSIPRLSNNFQSTHE
jgi:Trk-type K+ transport system membrane component